jgi:hypothetical protein
LTHYQIKEITKLESNLPKKLIHHFIEGIYDGKLSEFLGQIVTFQTKILNKKMDEINNCEIHFMTTHELLKKIDLVIFSEFNQEQKILKEKQESFGKVAGVQIKVKRIAKNLK